MIALRFVAAVILQHGHLFCGFHAFGDHAQMHELGHLHDDADDGRIAFAQ